MPIDPARFNPVVVRLLRSPLHWIASVGLCLVTVTGRKSGKRYTIPVGYQRDGDNLMILVSEASQKQWWRNYREPHPIEVRLRGRDRSGSGQLVPSDSPDFARWMEHSLRRVPRLDRQFGIKLDRKTGLTPEQVEHLASGGAIVRVRFSG